MPEALDEKKRLVVKRLWRVISYASNGFYMTLSDEDRIQNRVFLEIIKEAYRALETIYGYGEKGKVVES